MIRAPGDSPGEVVGDALFARVMARLGPWVPDRTPGGPDMPPVGIAVSGGADSLCLAFLAARWRRAVRALVVDHRLRAESAHEALLTLDRLRDLGIPADLLVLEGLRRGPGLADRARRARYAALTRACRQAGIIDLLLGHHADDQAETILIRRRAASGPDGLAGMAWISSTADLRLVRPLLGFGKERLRATLRHAGLAWIEDPSNADVRAERARVRGALAGDPERAELARRSAARAGRARMVADHGQAVALAARTEYAPGGWVALPADLLCPRALASVLRMVSGGDYPPSRRAVDALAAAPRAATLGGACLLPAGPALRRAGLAWLVVREEAAMDAAVPARAGACWDGRFVLWAPPGLVLDGVTFGAAGPVARWAPPGWRSRWPARAWRTLPALHRDGRVVAVPLAGICHAPDLADVRIALLPGALAAESGLFGDLPPDGPGDGPGVGPGGEFALAVQERPDMGV
nr:tRNA lysidine(34) synthetase TilS [Gluconacetobacter azotocaptans]